MKIQQIKSLYEQLPTIVTGLSFAIVMVTILLLTRFPAQAVLPFTAYMLCMCAIRLFTGMQLKREGYESRGVNFWLWLFVVLSAMTSAGIGSLVYNFFNVNDFVFSIFALVSFIAFLSAGILFNSCFMPAFIGFSLPATLIALSRLMSEREESLTTLSIIVMVYFIIILAFSIKANYRFMERVQWNDERESLVDELRQQKEAAEQAVESKSKFLASASHDLRQPLHAIGLFLDILRHQTTEQKNLETLDKVSASTQALNELLHSMLDISKLDANVVENNPENIHLTSFLEPIYTEFSVRAKEKNLSFSMRIDESLYVCADSILFERVVRNLIDNAIKFTKKGSVDIFAYRLTDSIDLSIIDTGIGIPDDQLENVFFEFNQLANPERDKRKGLGLGLSIVKRLCELMNVDIELQSEERSGTEITLNVPVGSEKVEASVSFSDPLSKRESSVVLVIEDDVAVLDGMSSLLTIFGFEVLKAITSKQAMRASSEVKPDLIIADYRLPSDEDGLELIDAIRAYHLECIPAILVTGDTAPDRIKITESADVIVLHKPVDPAVLEDTIEKALQ
jgi:signal transduction histidine kinase/CheY-like chemotaxis protein